MNEVTLPMRQDLAHPLTVTVRPMKPVPSPAAPEWRTVLRRRRCAREGASRGRVIPPAMPPLFAEEATASAMTPSPAAAAATAEAEAAAQSVETTEEPSRGDSSSASAMAPGAKNLATAFPEKDVRFV